MMNLGQLLCTLIISSSLESYASTSTAAAAAARHHRSSGGSKSSKKSSGNKSSKQSTDHHGGYYHYYDSSYAMSTNVNTSYGVSSGVVAKEANDDNASLIPADVLSMPTDKNQEDSSGKKDDGGAKGEEDVSSSSSPTPNDNNEQESASYLQAVADNMTASNHANSPLSLTSSERQQIIQTKCTGYNSISRAMSFLHLISTDSSLSNPEDVASLSSYQHMAWTWLTHLDDAILCPPISSEETTRVLQRYTMALIYYSTRGSKWFMCNSERANFFDEDDSPVVLGECDIQQDGHRFLSPSHECNWYGITCNDQAIVTSIDLTENHLQGRIPQELYGALKTLVKLDLQANLIGGELSSRVGELVDMKELRLNDNGMVGKIPFEEIATLGELDILTLGGNQMNGNATSMCLQGHAPQSTFETDCGDAEDSPVVCPCCTECK